MQDTQLVRHWPVLGFLLNGIHSVFLGGFVQHKVIPSAAKLFKQFLVPSVTWFLKNCYLMRTYGLDTPRGDYAPYLL